MSSSPAASAFDFDSVLERKDSSSTKWLKYGDRDILPFWVADMDFASPDFILNALHQRLEHPIIGYTDVPNSLTEAFQAWLLHHFDWSVRPEWVVWLPGIVPGLNMAARLLSDNARMLVPTPIYYPFLDLAKNAGKQHCGVALQHVDGRWQMDFQAMTEQAATTEAVFIANPQNPTSRCYTREELLALAEFAERQNQLLVSDEIHCNIILDTDCHHVPVAKLVPEIAERTISLFAATKTYNIPGLGCAAAVIPNQALRRRYKAQKLGMVSSLGPLNVTASEAAFNDRSRYLPELLNYLRGNVARLQEGIGDRLAPVEATYLAWIDIRDLRLNDPAAHFERHGLGLSHGAQFGAPGYIRFNFACPRSTLEAGLERLTAALASAEQ